MTTNKITVKERNRIWIAGLKKRFAGTPTVTLIGQPIATVDIEKLLQSQVDAADASAASKATWVGDVKAERDLGAKIRPLIVALKSLVYNLFGNDPDALNDFGLVPKKVRKPKATTQVAAAEKVRATRAARHTAGKRQKLAVKGVAAPMPPPGPVPAPVPVPPTANGGTAKAQ